MTEVDNGYAESTWNEHVANGTKIRPKGVAMAMICLGGSNFRRLIYQILFL